MWWQCTTLKPSDSERKPSHSCDCLECLPWAWWDVQELATFGFRGEALSSLCAVADVSIVTRTAQQAARARLSYDHEGRLAGQSAAARAVGTTVAVRDLFKPLPVRWAGDQLAVPCCFSCMRVGAEGAGGAR